MKFQFVENFPAVFIPDINSLVVADFHIGFEYELLSEGIRIPNQAIKFEKEMKKLIKSTGAEKLIILGDVKHKLSRITKGEEITARELSLLPQGYTVFHGLNICRYPGLAATGSDLDHVVVGPTGIFAVETKNWSDSITIENGELLYDGITPTRPPLEQVKNEAQSLRAYLKSKTELNLEVQPVLCFASNNLPQGEQGSSGVLVCNADRLTTVILSNIENHVTDSAQQSIIETLLKICET